MVQFVTLPQQGGDQRQVAEVVRGIMDGKTNNTGSITLATGGATSTTIYNERIGYDSTVLLSPTTTNAAGFSYYIDSNAQGSVVIRHAANVIAARTFKYIIVG